MRFSHHFLMSVSKKILVLSSLLALGAGMSASAAPRINGAGASFPAKIYQRWFAELARSGGPQVNYQSVGSGSGRKAFIDQTVNFAASDDPMKKKDMAKVGRGVVQIPMVGGTIAFGFNKPGCDLKLTQTQAVRVAMGKVRNWKELGSTLAVAVTSCHTPLLIAISKLCGDVALGVVGHEATRVGVAVIRFARVGNVVRRDGEISVAFVDVLLIGVHQTEATAGLFVPNAGDAQGSSEEVQDFLPAFGVGRRLVAHHLGVTS